MRQQCRAFLLQTLLRQTRLAVLAAQKTVSVATGRCSSRAGSGSRRGRTAVRFWLPPFLNHCGAFTLLGKEFTWLSVQPVKIHLQMGNGLRLQHTRVGRGLQSLQAVNEYAGSQAKRS